MIGLIASAVGAAPWRCRCGHPCAGCRACRARRTRGAGHEVVRQRLDGGEIAARRGRLGAREGDRAEAERDRATVDDADVQAVGATARAASSALCIVADKAPEIVTTRIAVAPRSARRRYDSSNRPGDGAAVEGSSGDAAHRAQNSAVVSCSRSTSSSSPKRMLRGTTSMPHFSARSSGRSHELSVTMPTFVMARRRYRCGSGSGPARPVAQVGVGLRGVGRHGRADVDGVVDLADEGPPDPAPAAEVPVPPRDQHEQRTAGDELAEAGQGVHPRREDEGILDRQRPDGGQDVDADRGRAVGARLDLDLDLGDAVRGRASGRRRRWGT